MDPILLFSDQEGGPRRGGGPPFGGPRGGPPGPFENSPGGPPGPRFGGPEPFNNGPPFGRDGPFNDSFEGPPFRGGRGGFDRGGRGGFDRGRGGFDRDGPRGRGGRGGFRDGPPGPGGKHKSNGNLKLASVLQTMVEQRCATSLWTHLTCYAYTSVPKVIFLQAPEFSG